MAEISFSSDIREYLKSVNHKIVIKETELVLKLNCLTNIKTYEILQKWQSCLALLGKGNLYRNKDASLIIYCLITDACIIDKINDGKVDIDLYNPILNRFYTLETIYESCRDIRLKIFPICNTMIIIDWKNFPTYKVYELFNLEQVKEYYSSKKVNFDKIIKDIGLLPKYCGKVCADEFKILSYKNHNSNCKKEYIKILEDFMIKQKKLEKEIQKEYKKLIKTLHIKAY